MPIAQAPPVRLTGPQRTVLEHLVRAARTPQALAQRARIVLGAADGESNRGMAQRLHLARNTVQCWRDRWIAAAEPLLATEAEGGADVDEDGALEQVIRVVLADEPRPGAPPTFTPEQWCQIMALACAPPGDSGRPISQWTPRELADEAVKRKIVLRISARSVGRFLVSGSGRAQAPSESLLAHATGGRPHRVRGAGADHL